MRGNGYMSGRFSNLDLLGLPDCVGLSEKGKCMWIDVEACRGEGCAFKRSVSDYRLSQLNTFQRLAGLGSIKQTYIAKRYYNGKQPWNEQGILE